MRLLPDNTILLAFVAGWVVATNTRRIVRHPTLLMEGGIAAAGFLLTWVVLTSMRGGPEGFATAGSTSLPVCSDCGTKWPCADHKDSGVSPICPSMPDMSKYVLKTSIPPCQNCPDLDKYMLKTECPPVPDMSQYVLKSSMPKQGPVIVDTSACKKQCGECPPCPRPRCPEVKCPAPTVCPACPPCPRPSCPQQVVKCRSEDVPKTPVRPFLAPLSLSGYGMS